MSRTLVLSGSMALFAAVAACGEGPGVQPAQEEAAFSASDYLPTPGGYRHRSCVHEIEEGARVEGQRVLRKDGTSYELPTCKFPLLADLKDAAPLSRASSATTPPTTSGWVEKVFWNSPPTPFYKGITATWKVPQAPANPYSPGQVYYTFPGLESQVFILQPVLSYGYREGIFSLFSPDSWAIASWRCDSGPNCMHSQLIPVNVGDVIVGSVVGSSCDSAGHCSWAVFTQDTTTGATTTLTLTETTEVYVFASAAVMETHGLTSCDQYPQKGVFFSGIALSDAFGFQLATTPWDGFIDSTVSPSCRFNLSSTATTANLIANPFCGVSLRRAAVTPSGLFGSPTDPFNCGACGNICAVPDNGQALCVNGGCTFSCNAGYGKCGNECVNLQADGHNCGRCGNVCAAGTTCKAGVCQSPCPACPSGTHCSGTSCVADFDCSVCTCGCDASGAACARMPHCTVSQSGACSHLHEVCVCTCGGCDCE
jgi:hypothetical protein